MARPAKTLADRLRDRSFLARRHAGLLAGPLLGATALRELQERWRAEPDEQVRSALGRQYERRVTAGVLEGDGDEVAESGAARASLPIAEFFPAPLAW